MFLAAVYDEHGEYDDHPGRVDQQVGGFFNPTKQTSVSEPEKFKGVSIKQFPKATLFNFWSSRDFLTLLKTVR